MTLVSILGDFHSSILPIFFEYKEKITKHIIVYDDSEHNKNLINKILKGQRNFVNNYESKDGEQLNIEIVTIKIDEDSYSSINQSFDNILAHTVNKDELYLNSTDGLSSIGIILVNKILDIGSKVISYDRYSNTYNLHTSNDMKKYTIKNSIDIKNHIKLIGYNILGYSNKYTLEKRKDIVLEMSQDLTALKEFSNDYPNHSPKYDDLEVLLNQLNIEPQQSKIFAQGTIFEEYIYWLIKDNCDFDEVMTGVRVEFECEHENELDILIIKDNHLHTIECKFVNSINGEHFVYKTNSIIDYLDDDGKAMILSIGGENERITNYGNKKTQFTLGDKARAKNGNIKIYQEKNFDKIEFLKVVRDWF